MDPAAAAACACKYHSLAVSAQSLHNLCSEPPDRCTCVGGLPGRCTCVDGLPGRSHIVSLDVCNTNKFINPELSFLPLLTDLLYQVPNLDIQISPRSSNTSGRTLGR